MPFIPLGFLPGLYSPVSGTFQEPDSAANAH